MDQFWGCVEQAEPELAVEGAHLRRLVVEQATPELSGEGASLQRLVTG